MYFLNYKKLNHLKRKKKKRKKKTHCSHPIKINLGFNLNILTSVHLKTLAIFLISREIRETLV